MKQRPNISVHKNSKLINYVREKVLSDINGTYQSGSAQDLNNDLQLHNDLVRNNPLPSTQFIPKGKTKSKPSTPVIQKRDINKTNQFRVEMIKFGSSDTAIYPDLLIENSDNYILTITSHKLLYGIETPTSKDLDIYCNGLRLDASTYSVLVRENIVITIQKTEAVDGIVGEDFDVTSFEIISKFDPLLLGVGDVDGDGEEDSLITENNEDILK